MAGDRGVFAGGYKGSISNVIDYVTISATGNATDFGDLNTSGDGVSGCSNNTNERGVFQISDVIDYITINSTGNASDFGDPSVTRSQTGSCSNATNERGIFSGGIVPPSTYSNVIDYITINSTGNATDFGDLTHAGTRVSSCSNGTNERGCFGGRYDGIDPTYYYDIIDYITINSTGNATDFGDLTRSKYGVSSTSNGTNERGIFGGGATASDIDDIDYITINSTGNATDFGDLNQSRSFAGSCSNYTSERGLSGGGGTWKLSIEYITINSTGNGIEFGNLTDGRRSLGACSNGPSSPGYLAKWLGGVDMTTVLIIDTICRADYNIETMMAEGACVRHWGGGPCPPTHGDRGVFAGGYSSFYDVIDYITISSTGNATDFGNMTHSIGFVTACSNGLNDRGCIGGGYDGSVRNYIDYITISTPGNASDFGDLNVASYSRDACSNGTNERGCIGGGVNSSYAKINSIEYITINSTGNGTDFGDLTVARHSPGACSNYTNERGVWAGGYSTSNVIDYITINSTGNATDFGDLTVARYDLDSCSNATNERGCFAGGKTGSTWLNTIDYITINSTGNATDFGNLTLARRGCRGSSNGTNERGVFGNGEYANATYTNVIDYITINSTGNATDFGDATISVSLRSATSNW